MEHLDHPSPHFNDAKMARFCTFAPSSLLLGGGGKGVNFSFLFGPRLSEIHTGVTRCVIYGNGGTIVAVARLKDSLYIRTQTLRWRHTQSRLKKCFLWHLIKCYFKRFTYFKQKMHKCVRYTKIVNGLLLGWKQGVPLAKWFAQWQFICLWTTSQFIQIKSPNIAVSLLFLILHSQTKWSVPLKITLTNWLFEYWTW